MTEHLEPKTLTHFGLRIRKGDLGYKLSHENYALPNRKPTKLFGEYIVQEEDVYYGQNEKGDVVPYYNDQYLKDQRHRAIENLDLNMNFFDHLPQDEFDSMVEMLQSKFEKLQDVEDLTPYSGVRGVYAMILGDYKQVYVGQSENIATRIRQHWTSSTAFDRTIFGDVYTSVLSIKAFRALDTTRILVSTGRDLDLLEKNIIDLIPSRFRLNRIAGGKDIASPGTPYHPGLLFSRDLLQNPK